MPGNSHMSQFNRRRFMKTLLVTAVGAAPAYAGSPARIALPSFESDLASLSTNLENGFQQLRISPTGSPLAFQNFLRVGDEWKPATLANNAVVTGASFVLVTSHVRREGSSVFCEGVGNAEGLDGKGSSYGWQSEISALSHGDDAPWFRFRTTLHLPAPIRLHENSRIEPQVINWLSSSSTLMEGQSGSWRRVLLEQPTRNSLGTYGNDLPAVYLLDQNLGVETMMYFDVSDMSWMSTENLPRFLVYRCSSISRIERDGTQRLGLGLLAEQATGNVLPAGDVNFTYWLLQRPLTRLLTEQESVARWMQALLLLFEEKLTWPACATSWKEFAAGTVEDLQDKSAAQIETKGHTGLRAYVKASSQLWNDSADNFETAQKMAEQYDYLFPIYYQVATLRTEGAGTNYAVGGLYAWAAILANRLTGENQYLEEARRAVHVLYTVPAERLFHEPQELAYGALAAAELGMTEEAKYLLYEQLRMFYWYSDPSQTTHDIRGMVQAAASILYPAFKENVEAILPWTGVMKRGIVFEGLLRFMDQQRRNNFYFFEDCSANRKRGFSAFIPFENLGTLELAGMTGNVGKEIYGAGESLWMYLMFEALGEVSDRELMLVNLDLLDIVHAREFPPRKLNFILYNPTAIARSANIQIPAAKEHIARLNVNGKASETTVTVPKQSFIHLLADF